MVIPEELGLRLREFSYEKTPQNILIFIKEVL